MLSAISSPETAILLVSMDLWTTPGHFQFVRDQKGGDLDKTQRQKETWTLRVAKTFCELNLTKLNATRMSMSYVCCTFLQSTHSDMSIGWALYKDLHSNNLEHK